MSSVPVAAADCALWRWAVTTVAAGAATSPGATGPRPRAASALITRVAADAGVGALGAAAVAVAAGAAVTVCASGAGSLTAAAGTVTFGAGAVAALGAGAMFFGDRIRTRSEPATPVARSAWASSAEVAGAGVLVRLAADRRVGADDDACAAGAAEASVG